MEMSDPASLLTVRLGLRVSLLARSWPGAKPFFHLPLSACFRACVLMNMSCLLFLIYTRFSGGDSLLAVGVLGWFSTMKKHVVVAQLVLLVILSFL